MEAFKSMMTFVTFVTVLSLLVPSAAPAYHHSDDPRLAWAPPSLEEPVTVQVTEADTELELDDSRDYVLRMPPEPLLSGLSVNGGHHVVLIGGEIWIPDQGPDASESSRRGLMLSGQTGVVHVEGLLVGGEDLSEGIDIDERLGGVVQLENVRVERLRARDEVDFSDGHPDLIQSWAGPAELRVDRFTGTTDYQGIFLSPQEFGSQDPPRAIDLRRVNISSTPSAHYLFWQEGDSPLHLDDVWARPNPRRGYMAWPEDGRWSRVKPFPRPWGDFVPEGEAGLGYASPGYRAGG
jgi:hypothetical protein